VGPVDLSLVAGGGLKALRDRLGRLRPGTVDVAAHGRVAARKAVVADEVLVDAGRLQAGVLGQPLVDHRFEGVELGGHAPAPVARLGSLGQVVLHRAPVAADDAADLGVGQPLAVQGSDVHELLLVDQLLASFKFARSGELEGATGR
jgi:hypothetical protein